MKRPMMLTALAALGLACLFASCGDDDTATIVVGSKNFTEQVILGEMLAQVIEQEPGLRADRKLDLGGTFICHKALAAGEIDVYVEYTGTALAAILERPPLAGADAGDVLDLVRQQYRSRFDAEWLSPLGFNNTFALIVRPDDAARESLSGISDLSRVGATFRAGFGYEFLERADGYSGLTEAYGFKLEQDPAEMDLGLLYRALEEGQVDVVAGNSTDGLIASMGLVVLDDDRGYFPPYDAVAVVRTEILRRYPAVRRRLESLAGRIDEDRMRRMNFAVDGEHRSTASVAGEFLREEGLID